MRNLKLKVIFKNYNIKEFKTKKKSAEEFDLLVGGLNRWRSIVILPILGVVRPIGMVMHANPPTESVGGLVMNLSTNRPTEGGNVGPCIVKVNPQVSQHPAPRSTL